MSEPHGTFPGFETNPATNPSISPATDTTPADAVPAGAAPADAAPTDASPVDAGTDGFDRARVMRLLERLERDVATVEAAMGHVEAGEHEAYAAAVAAFEPRLAD